MTVPQSREQRVALAASAFMALLDEIVPESAYYRGERQDDAKVNGYAELIEKCTRQEASDGLAARTMGQADPQGSCRSGSDG